MIRRLKKRLARKRRLAAHWYELCGADPRAAILGHFTEASHWKHFPRDAADAAFAAA